MTRTNGAPPTSRNPRLTADGDRLPRLSASLNRGREVRVGILGVLAIIVLVIGIPVALSIFVGYPLPRSAPSRHWLTQDITATLIIKILACIVWVLWAHFTVCVIAEWRALRRGRLPRDLPFGGGSQALARRLVAAALLLSGAATAFGGMASSTSGHGQVARAPISVAQHAGGSGMGEMASGLARIQTGAEPQAAVPMSAHESAAATARAMKTYTVAPPHGRHYDSLWDIADRTLGDPLRYKEIFALNKDRVQADGSKLVDANLIRPGWQLRLPADASGPGVHETAVGAARTDAQATDTADRNLPAEQPAASAQSTITPASGAQTSNAPTNDAQPASGRSRAAGTGQNLPAELIGGGLMLAGLLLALSARRGPYGTAEDAEASLIQSADFGLAAALDRALRDLSARRADQRRELPQPVLAWVSYDGVSLALAGGDTNDPPRPWHRGEDGTWDCRFADLSESHPRLGATAAPFPALLSVGRDAQHEVFVDVEQAPGLISFGGDLDRARDLINGLAAHAVTNAWSDGAKVTLIGFGDRDALGDLDARRIATVAALSDVLPDLEHDDENLQLLQRRAGVADVLAGRQLRRDARWQPRILVLSGPPTDTELARLQDLVGTSRTPFVVLILGDCLDAAWRFVVDASGALDLGVLGTSVVAHRFDRKALGAIVSLMREAASSARHADADISALRPREALAEIGDRQTSVRNGPALVPGVRPAGNAASGVRVCVLGPVRVDAGGPLPAGQRELLTEIVLAVALDPNGAHEAVLRGVIWPRGIGDDVFSAAMADAVRWLGHDAEGRPVLGESGGRWSLGPGAWLDWEQLQGAVGTSDGPHELDQLLGCVDLFRGEAFSGTPASRYRWLTYRRAVRDVNVLATSVVRRAAGLLFDAQRAGDAEVVLRRGVLLVPTAEVLWRDLLALVAPGGPEAAAAVAAEMYDVLSAHRVWPGAETDALVAQVAPGFEVPQTA